MKNFLGVFAVLLLAQFGSTTQATLKYTALLPFSKQSYKASIIPERMHYFVSNHWYRTTIWFSQYPYRCVLFIMIAVLSSCSRPVTYFQRAPANLPTTLDTQPVSAPPLNQIIASPLGPVINANTTIPQPEFVARDNNKLVPTKLLSKRMGRVKTWLVSTHETVKPQGNCTVGRTNAVESVMIQKTSQKKSRQFTPSATTKAMANWIKLIGGVILLVAGVAIMLAGPGSIFFLGLVVALFGFVGIILGLFAE